MNTVLRKMLFGLMVATLIFLFVEGMLWALASFRGLDWRVDPLPSHPEYSVLCDMNDMKRLCPDQGPEYERVRPEVFFQQPSGKRVIAIGESFVYGLGLPDEQAWPEQMSKQLGADVEIINMGRCGTYASRLMPIVKAAIELQPDVIVLSTGNNEHTMTSFYTGKAGRSPLRTYQLSTVLGRSQLYGVLFRGIAGSDVRVIESFTDTPDEITEPDDLLAYAARRRPPQMDKFPDALASRSVTRILEEEQRLKEKIFTGHVRKMIELITEAQIDLVLTTLPRDLSVPPVLSGTHIEEEEELRGVVRALNTRDPSSQEDWVGKGLALSNKVSLFLYEKAMIYQRKGDMKNAVLWVRKNISWELIPDATPEINQIIRDLGTEYKVPVVDLDRYADQYLTNPRKVFLDKVHVNARGASEVASLVAEEVSPLLK
jgi:lysophospholipase L1-like esterase